MLMDLHTYLLFLGAVVVLVLLPGPDMAYMLARTVAQGRRAGVVAAIGINVGAYVHVLAAVFGLSAVLATSATAFTIVKTAGAGYLIWIGLRMLLARPGPSSDRSPEAARMSDPRIFWEGFLCDVLNPKVAIFFLAFLPQFVEVDSARSVTHQLLVLGVTVNVVAVVMNIALVFVASAATNALRKRTRAVQWLDRSAGALFIALGLRLARERL